MEEQRKLKRDQELKDIGEVAKTPQGQRLLTRLFTRAKLHESTFTGNSQGFFLEGGRNLALVFLNDLCLAAPEEAAEILLKTTKGARNVTT